MFDCFGAGQKVSKHTFAGESWRDDVTARQSMFAVFPIVRRLHELLWYLDQALTLPGSAPLRDDLSAHFEHVQRISNGSPEQLREVDIDHLYDAARLLLIEASAAARRGRASESRRADRRQIGPGADLMGANLAGAELRGATLRGSLLIGADLAGADLSYCDVLGVDFRDANLVGARLHGAIFLTQMQVNSARGDDTTTLPPGFERPAHW